MSLFLRREAPGDVEAISRVTEAAFRDAPHSSHTEQHIVNALRRRGQLIASLVAVDGDAIVGHVAISPVSISTDATGWFGLGPISVAPDRQRRGIGSALVLEALVELRRLGGRGCVLLGEPAYYGGFGFKHEPSLVLPGVPPEYFQVLSFDGAVPAGTVTYDDAFTATA